MLTTRYPSLILALLLLLIPVACSRGPAPPQKGTPAFYWQAAQETYRAGDYLRTVDHLEALAKTENEFSAKAHPWRLVLLSGLASGYMTLAEHFEVGGRTNKANPTPFRRVVSDSRTRANRVVLQFAEGFAAFQKAHPEESIAVSMPFPRGSHGFAPELLKAGRGIVPQEMEVETAQRRTLERGVLLATCKAVGAPGDTAKAQEVLKTETAQVPRAVFVTAMANSLNDAVELYSRMQLDQPNRRVFVMQTVLDAIKSVPETKETKELVKKLEAGLKKEQAK